MNKFTFAALLALALFTSFSIKDDSNTNHNCQHQHAELWNALDFHLPNDAKNRIEPLGKTISTIVIDPGHGGKDSGCIGAVSKVKEKDVTLKIALKLGEYIKKAYPKLNVVYTRKDDTLVPLHERASVANKNKADLFISIHCNAAPSLTAKNKAVSGTETYVMGLHTAAENLRVAKRENEVILLEDNYKKNYDGFDPNSPEGHIMLSMAQDAYLSQSIHLASKIDNQFRYTARRNSRGVKQAGFVVLRQTTMPSVLIESGFLTNQYEEKFLNTAHGQGVIASCIYRAFKEYYVEINPTAAGASTNTFETASKGEESLNYMKPVKGVVYKVQLAAASQPIDTKSGAWKNVTKIEVSKEDKTYKYLSESYKSYDVCLKAQQAIKAKGFKDAFIVAYQDGKKISIADAKAINGK
jgi:N-acetylmuramoyl-L-alanine amidase